MTVLSLRTRYRPAFVDPFAEARAARAARRTTVGNLATTIGLDDSSANTSRTSSSSSSSTGMDLAKYVAAPAISGALLTALLGGGPIWAIVVAAAAGGGGYAYLQSQSVQGADLCVEQLPEPARTQAKTAIASKNKTQLDSLATQADAKGWHCAAKEMRAAAPDAGTLPAASVDRALWVPGCTPPADWKPPADAQLGSAPPSGMFPGWTPAPDWVLGKASPGNCPPGWTIATTGAGPAGPSVISSAAMSGISSAVVTPECWELANKLPKDVPYGIHIGSSDTVQPPDLRAWARDVLTSEVETAIEAVGQFTRQLFVRLDEMGKSDESKPIHDASICFLDLAEKMRSPGFKKAYGK